MNHCRPGLILAYILLKYSPFRWHQLEGQWPCDLDCGLYTKNSIFKIICGWGTVIHRHILTYQRLFSLLQLEYLMCCYNTHRNKSRSWRSSSPYRLSSYYWTGWNWIQDISQTLSSKHPGINLINTLKLIL